MSVAAAVAESSETAGGGLVAAAGKYLAVHEPDKQAIRPSLSVKTAHSWRGILARTLAREGRMTVTIGRRELLAALGGAAAAWPLAARAQQQPKMLRVGFVGIQPREAPVYTNFLKRMAELGYQEGRNFAFDYIQTPDVEGYERNYRELAARKVDVFLAVGTEQALRAALLAAEGKPIVLLAIDFDPVARGYVASLSRPGGSVTGIFVRQLELAAKRVEIAREAFPRATVLGIAFDTISREQRDGAAEAARKLGLEPRMIEVKSQQDYGGAFSAMDDARGQPIILPASPMFFRDREAIAQVLLERRIPSIAAFRENLEAGALISYGFDLMGLFYDIASYVHRIAGGAKPSDTPIEQSPRFYMAVNLKTAALLGISLSDVFIARANEVRE
jgi:putative tryptophan/tyrosine transport system substrate-binding protein